MGFGSMVELSGLLQGGFSDANDAEERYPGLHCPSFQVDALGLGNEVTPVGLDRGDRLLDLLSGVLDEGGGDLLGGHGGVKSGTPWPGDDEAFL